MKKFLALAMAGSMAFSLAACGGNSASSSSAAGATSSATAEEAAASEITGIAQVCDVGTIDDESFNQGCWEAVQAFGEANGIAVEYYLPSDDNDEERQTLIRNAINDGANTVVCVGYLYGPALAWASEEYPDVNFIGVDMTAADIGTETIPGNVYCITYKEEQAGYLAGYAAVKDGFTELGFLGGMAVPAVIRYGYGFVQGADAAAQEMGANIHINYWYGGAFSGDANITAKMESWYSGGTQVVFACGGGIYTSAVEAAVKYDGKVIGVDVDQNYIGEQDVESGKYSYNPFVTSAMKGLNEGVTDALDHVMNGTWSNIAGTNGVYGLQEGDYVGLPTAEGSWNFSTFTVEEYEAVKEQIRSGEIVVDDSSDDTVKPTVSENTTVDYQV
ncbi:MAG TPA: BMP family ABC transporter substrate-binding protein [Candidatus Gemmiger avistercoris]|uniref:BMP family ABC transporter substrate-binding protein n=1 Tax=Candidatus Gemmiger avistercoris TaxID=2838606 RepID=A0A9D2FJV2_9FIRM|nr:BMP family ABC transporter substrate-binding protein [uncultured Subdoligranulum sp.]HIZ62429.1 BMP family ABC transporter substrate-binding protein [Candidatus Gemmiger avistercoris]